MKILIKNTTIIAMDKEDNVIQSDILIENDKIKKIKKNILDKNVDKIIDGSSCITLPALANAHCHLAMTGLRNYADDLELMKWLVTKIFPIENLLTPDDIYAFSLLGAAELIHSGVSCYSDMYFMQEQTIKAIKKAQLSANIGLTLFGDVDENKKRLSNFDNLSSLCDNDIIRLDLAPHSIYTCTKGTLELTRDFAYSNNLLVNIHMSESKTEIEDCKKEHNQTPFEYCNSFNFFKAKTYAAHCVHLFNNDYSIMRDNNISAVHNISSNLKLASGFSPILKLKEEGVNVGLGTDGCASNNNLNMFEEMHLTSLVHKAYLQSDTACKAYQTLQMATQNSFKALRREKIGEIKEGYYADIMMVNYKDKAHLTPINNPISAIVYCVQASDVYHLFSRGKHILDKNVITTFDEKEAIRLALKQNKDLLKRAKKEGLL